MDLVFVIKYLPVNLGALDGDFSVSFFSTFTLKFKLAVDTSRVGVSGTGVSGVSVLLWDLRFLAVFFCRAACNTVGPVTIGLSSSPKSNYYV